MRARAMVGTFLVLAAPILFAACGASSGGARAGDPGVLPPPCAQPAGAYVVTADLLSTDCPGGLTAHTEKLELMTKGAPPGCSTIDMRASPAPGGCNYEETQSCPNGETAIIATLSLFVPQDPSDLRGTSVVQLESKGVRCLGRYRVRYVKNPATH